MIFISIYLILPASLSSGFTQLLTGMSTRNRKIIMFLGNKVRPVRSADNLPPSVSRLPRQSGIRNISQLYRPPRPVTGTAFFFFLILGL
jgi:hypothetical protein